MNIEQQQELETTDLKQINGVSFTSRELDIISFILAGRAAKKTAAFLSISPRTVEIHIRNIMLKIECNSQESIIDFIEKSDKLMLIKKHYLYLLVKARFETELQKIQKLTKVNSIECLILYFKPQRTKDLFISKLENHLSIAGIKTISKIWEKNKIENTISREPVNYIIYVLSDEFATQLAKLDYNLQTEASRAAMLIKQNAKPIIFVSLNSKPSPTLASTEYSSWISLSEAGDYYSLVFELIKKIIPKHNIDGIIAKFKQQHATIMEYQALPHSPTQNKLSAQSKFTAVILKYFNNPILKYATLFLLLFGMAAMFFNIHKYYAITSKKDIVNIKKLQAAIENKIRRNFAAGKINSNNVFAENLQENSKQLKFGQDIILLNLPPRNTKFTGRSLALKQVEQQLNKYKFGITTQVISGLGGVGKTQLATEFAYQAVEKKIYKSVLFVTTATQNAIHNAYREFARALQIDTRGLKPNEIQGLVHSKLTESQHDTKFLFILDNAPNYNDIQNYIGTLHKQLPKHFPLHILITSRSQYWPEHPIILEDFTDKEALAFTRKQLPNEEKSAILRLAKELHYFPLALGQAVAYIKAHTNIDDYLELYQAREKEYLDLFAGEKNQYTESLWKTWDIALSKLDTNAMDMLFISSYLYPDDIPITFFSNLTIEERVAAIKELRKHSFIILTNNNKSFKIHRLLQETIRLNIENPKQSSYLKNRKFFVNLRGNKKKYTANELWLLQIIELLKEKFSYNYMECAKWDTYKKYLPHALAISEHVAAIKKDIFQPGLKIYSQAAMFITYIQPDLKEAAHMWTEMLLLLENYPNKTLANLSRAKIYKHLSYVMHEIGEIDKSNEYLAKALMIYRKPIMHVREQELINNLRLLPIAKVTDGGDLLQYDLCAVLILLGNNARAVGHYNDALLHYNEAFSAIAKCEKNIVYQYFQANILRDLGTVSIYNGNFIDAEKNMLIAKNIADAAFSNHPLQLQVHESLGALLYNIGEFEDAKILLEAALQKKLTMFSRFHPGIAHTNMLLGGVHNMREKQKFAEDNLKQSELIYDAEHGNSHYCYIFLYLRFSRVYEKLQQYDKALAYLQKTLELAKLHFGERLHTAMAFQLSAAEIWPKSVVNANVSYLQKTLTTTVELFGDSHMQTARYHYLLGLAYAAKNKNKIADTHYKKALAIFASKQGVQHPNLMKIFNINLALIKKRNAMLPAVGK